MAAVGDRPGEFEVIERYFRPLATEPGAFGLADDAAQIDCAAGETLVVTADLLSAGVHFFTDDPPAAIARKALRVNLSDLAAKGAVARGYFLSLALADDWNADWISAFVGGLAEDQALYDVSLLGGDTSRASATTVSITAVGRIPAGKMVLRSGARPGDCVIVSGTIGDAALGLRIRRGTLDAGASGGACHLLDRYLLPQPRTVLAPIVRRYASSALDVSDGLVGDLAHVCAASGVSAEIDATSVPLSAPARVLVVSDESALATVLGGGDDYEILATVAPTRVEPFAKACAAAGVPVTTIGHIVAGSGAPVVRGRGGRVLTLDSLSHVHF